MKKSIRGAAAACALALWVVTPLAAQSAGDDLKQEIEALKKGQQEIQKQLAEIKTLLQARPAPPPAAPTLNVKDVPFNLGANPIRGADSAKLILIEFSDYQ